MYAVSSKVFRYYSRAFYAYSEPHYVDSEKFRTLANSVNQHLLFDLGSSFKRMFKSN